MLFFYGDFFLVEKKNVKSRMKYSKNINKKRNHIFNDTEIQETPNVNLPYIIFISNAK